MKLKPNGWTSACFEGSRFESQARNTAVSTKNFVLEINYRNFIHRKHRQETYGPESSLYLQCEYLKVASALNYVQKLQSEHNG